MAEEEKIRVVLGEKAAPVTPNRYIYLRRRCRAARENAMIDFRAKRCSSISLKTG